MTQNEDNQISQHIGNTILVVMMEWSLATRQSLTVGTMKNISLND
ncbi:MAG: hypothetical protein CM1200mP35_06040 [Chloroflexota bacterium]|nr:MAG: hypothetical protein CM1200mP35_06040 [Chloroflexota bacterium]